MKKHVTALGHPLVAPCTATTVPRSADGRQCCVPWTGGLQLPVLLPLMSRPATPRRIWGAAGQEEPGPPGHGTGDFSL